MNTNAWIKTDRELRELLDEGLFQEIQENCEINQNNLFAKWTEQDMSGLRSSLRLGKAILEKFSRVVHKESEEAYSIMRIGALTGMVECLEYILYERLQDKFAEDALKQQVKTIKHLPKVIETLENHGILTHSELSKLLKINPPTLTEAMKKITETGAVNVTYDGKYKLYALSELGLRCGRQLREEQSQDVQIQKMADQLRKLLQQSERSARYLDGLLREEKRIEKASKYSGQDDAFYMNYMGKRLKKHNNSMKKYSIIYDKKTEDIRYIRQDKDIYNSLNNIKLKGVAV